MKKYILKLAEIRKLLTEKHHLNIGVNDIIYSTINGEPLYALKQVANHTGISINKLAYTLNVLQIEPSNVSGNAWLYDIEGIDSLAFYLIQEYRVKEILSHNPHNPHKK